jgi:uncharacterized membrane protein YqiK
MPVKQKARILSLALREAEIQEECVTNQGIPLAVRAVSVFKVGDDPGLIANAARRFLSEQDQVENLVGRVFAGHLRSIVGGLTVEQIIRERDRVAQEIKDSSHSEMEKLGLIVDSLQIQEIEDRTGYIRNLAAPHAAAVERDARIAAAQANQAATEREQQAAAKNAEFTRDSQVQQAGYRAEVEQATALAAQAGPLAQAKATQQVIEEQTALAQRKADLAAQDLSATVNKPADAEAYRVRTLAQAERDALQLRAEGLRSGNQQLIAANRLIEQLPELVAAAASSLNTSNLVVLNGTEGVNQMLSGLVSQGISIYDVLRKSLALPMGGGLSGSIGPEGTNGSAAGTGSDDPNPGPNG